MAKRLKKQAGEAQVYHCTWEMRQGVYALRCLLPVQARAANRNLELAKDELLAKIMDATGDGEALLQFDKPLPETSKKKDRYVPEYHHIEYHDMVEWTRENHAKLYADGACGFCGTGLGPRTDVSREGTSVPKYDVVGFRKDKNIREMISDIVLRHIRPFLPKETKLIPVKFPEGILKKIGVRKFYEIDFSPTSEVAIPKLNDGIGGWRCPKCRSQVLLFMARRLRAAPSLFVQRQSAHGKVLLLGKGQFRIIAVNAQLNKKLTTDRKIKGYASDRLVVLDEDEALSLEDIGKIRLPKP
jgi:hypothetical protein